MLVRRHPHEARAENAGSEKTSVEVDGVAWPVEVRGPRIEGDDLVVELGGQLERFAILAEEGAVVVGHRGAMHRFELGDGDRRHHDSEDDVVVAPLPGILVAVNVAPGDAVHPGDTLGVLESMKMEYPLKAKLPATVTRVGVWPRVSNRPGRCTFRTGAGPS